MSNNYYKCPMCGKVVQVAKEGHGSVICCGQPMVELEANVTEASYEKHVPKVTVVGSRILVEVGEVAHPMEPEHFIQWIEISQSGKVQRVALNPQCAPMATFIVDTLEPVDVFEYCNIHGLWGVTVNVIED